MNQRIQLIREAYQQSGDWRRQVPGTQEWVVSWGPFYDQFGREMALPVMADAALAEIYDDLQEDTAASV